MTYQNYERDIVIVLIAQRSEQAELLGRHPNGHAKEPVLRHKTGCADVPDGEITIGHGECDRAAGAGTQLKLGEALK